MAAVPYIEEYTVEGFVRASALELWNLLSDPIDYARSRKDITEIEVLDGVMGEKGCRTRTTHKVGKTDFIVTEDTLEADKPRLLVKRALNAQMTSTSRWEIEDADGGAKVTVTSTLEASLGMVQRWFITRQAMQRERSAIDAVREQCEEYSVFFDKRRTNLGFDI
ncbi:SRPBCC family protein [Demequina salsinemoris]|uniref:SRPBCC family protein n=1 Tax=Demequina salsinemoris TaxID=577470 RepID=UPI00078249F7|nr:SRPBCC family protein [Demequina salsinemoris]